MKPLIEQFKRAITDAGIPAPSGEPLSPQAIEWAASCDGYTSLKLHIPGATDPGGLETVARGCLAAIRATEQGRDIRALVVEFVDKQGAVIHTARPAITGSASREAKPSGAAPGHKPIGGLADTKSPRSNPAKSNPGQASQTRAQNPQDSADAMPGVTRAIAVGAGKGGVGKSTIAVNLAVALARKGLSVGLLDADIYGPSLPTMLGLDTFEQVVHAGKLQPHLVHGVKAITIGKLVDPEKPLIWRGPMAHGAFKQLLEQTEWGTLDYLVIDLPPGTGDVPLTMAQMIRLTGAVIVCTPQRVAQDDATRAARMFQQLGVPILGVVENMSFFIGDDEKVYDIFGRGGAEQMAQRMGLPYLGGVPINTALRTNSDSGDPSANFNPESAGGEALPRALTALADNLQQQVSLASLDQGFKRPTINIS